jgi:hypothetical protein
MLGDGHVQLASGLPRLRQLTPADLARMVELQAAVTAGLPAGFIRPKTARDLASFVDGTLGVAYGIVEGAALSAVSLLRLPSGHHPHKSRPFPLVPEEDWPLSACFLESTMVAPVARGRGYQRALVDARLSHAASVGMRWVCAGVHLQNAVSWANLLSRGMAIAGIRLDLGYPLLGLLRALAGPALSSDPCDRITVCAQDHAQHQLALQAGYIGVHLTPDGAVTYRKLLGQAAASDRKEKSASVAKATTADARPA